MSPKSAAEKHLILTCDFNIAAPQVAGLIATYLSYSTKPWDDSKTGVERVKAIRDYVTSEHSSWVRASGSNIRVIWNGATKADHGDDDDDDDDDDGDDDDVRGPVATPASQHRPAAQRRRGRQTRSVQACRGR